MALIDPRTNKKVAIEKGRTAKISLIPDDPNHSFTISFGSGSPDYVSFLFDGEDDKMFIEYGGESLAIIILESIGHIVDVSWKRYSKSKSDSIILFEAL